jgi:anti-sigma B factor antagonist
MTFTSSSLDSGTLRIVIEGELDAVTAGDVRQEVDRICGLRPKRVEVDLSKLRMVDSSGVGALVSLYKRVRAQEGEVVIMGLRDQPLAIFRLLRLDRVMIGSDLPAPAGSVPTARS